MSTSLLYPGFGLIGYEYVRTRYAGRGGHFFHQAQTTKVSLFVLSESGHYLSGNDFQTISDGSHRFEEGVSGL
jgi:hypothetical protein